ncbi:MAG: DUF1552 domain-containing protein, partial [Acidobacteria bacterium]|nr:DUF1552 domain-containing protein [Acidobacteriota bacterium]
FDMQALAFQTDSTRVITFQIGREQSGATYPQIGVSDSHHPISHHGGDPKKIASLQRINTYHVSLLGYFLDKLAATDDGQGSVLDNAVILYGSAISEGNRHDSRNLPLLLAGGAGGRIDGGRHLKYPARTQRLTNLQLTLLNMLGVPAEKFGDSAAQHAGRAGGEVRRQYRRAARRAVRRRAGDHGLAGWRPRPPASCEGRGPDTVQPFPALTGASGA